MNERVAGILSAVKGPRVLDVGCAGQGDPRTPLHQHHWLHGYLRKRNYELVGVDINEEAVAQMRAEGFTVEVMNAETMDFDNTFDTIVAGELIEHLENPGQFLGRALRHLNASGQLVLTTPNPFTLMHALAYLKNFDRAFNPDHACWFDPQTIRQLLERCGFRIDKLWFVDDLQPDIDPSWYYKAFCSAWRLFRPFWPRRFRNTVVVVASPRSAEAGSR